VLTVLSISQRPDDGKTAGWLVIVKYDKLGASTGAALKVSNKLIETRPMR
jgi:hypothetical protein